MLRKLFLIILLATWRLTAGAHPPSTIVVNFVGQVFYSDLNNIWMLNSDGSKEVILHGVHTHHLWPDHDGNLYGEDVQNEGDNYRHRIWRLSTDGTLSNVLEWTMGHPSDLGGVETIRNHLGESVILDRRDRRVVVGRESKTPRVVHLDDAEGDIHELAIGPTGDVFVASGNTIYLIEHGSQIAIPFTSVELARTSTFDFVHDRHALMGMHATRDHLYVTVFSGQRVLQIDMRANIQNVIPVPGDWSPVAVTTDRNDNVWVLEASVANEVRVTRYDPEGNRSVF